MTVLHLRGVLLPDEIERDVWLVDGRLTFDRYAGAAETISDGGYVLPGFVDAHCHIGLAPEGHVPDPDGQARKLSAIVTRVRYFCAMRDRRWTTPACSGATICLG